MRNLTTLCLCGLAALGGCYQEPPPVGPRPDSRSRSVKNDDPQAGFYFDDAKIGQWQTLSGEVTNLLTEEAMPISYRFEIAAADEQSSEPDTLMIQWSNDDEQMEFGSFTVPVAEELSFDEYLPRLQGPFGGRKITGVTMEEYRLGDRSWWCRRVDGESRNEHGELTVTLWLSAETPVARVVACRSHWEPVAEWAQLSPKKDLHVELSAYGDEQATHWSRAQRP